MPSWRRICSKPTYEGWKHLAMQRLVIDAQRSKPTYEGWKLFQLSKFLQHSGF